MKGHWKIAFYLLVIEVRLHSPVESFFVANDAAELQMVGNFVALLEDFYLRKQVSLFHVLFWPSLDASSRFNVVPPVLVVGLIENEAILIAPLVLSFVPKVILCDFFRLIFGILGICQQQAIFFREFICLQPHLLSLVDFVDLELRPNEVRIFWFRLFDPPTSLAHDPPYQSAVVSFADIVLVTLLRAFIHEASIVPNLPNEISVVQLLH